MEKTAMQELMDNIEHSQLLGDAAKLVVLTMILDHLPIERQQIEDAFSAGTKARYVKGLKLLGISHLPEGVETGAEYFTKKYGQ